MARTKKSKVERKKVEFKLFAPEAEDVKLVADFTDWEKSPHCMEKQPSGAWKKTVCLPEGAYHYRFIVDGEWQNDPEALASEPNPFGTRDNVRVVV